MRKKDVRNLLDQIIDEYGEEEVVKVADDTKDL